MHVDKSVEQRGFWKLDRIEFTVIQQDSFLRTGLLYQDSGPEESFRILNSSDCEASEDGLVNECIVLILESGHAFSP